MLTHLPLPTQNSWWVTPVTYSPMRKSGRVESPARETLWSELRPGRAMPVPHSQLQGVRTIESNKSQVLTRLAGASFRRPARRTRRRPGPRAESTFYYVASQNIAVIPNYLPIIVRDKVRDNIRAAQVLLLHINVLKELPVLYRSVSLSGIEI